MRNVYFSKCEWDKRFGILRLSTEYGLETYPFFTVTSDRTGKSVKFVPLEPGDDGYDEDGWDGEMSVYKPTEPCGVKQFIHYNQY